MPRSRPGRASFRATSRRVGLVSLASFALTLGGPPATLVILAAPVASAEEVSNAAGSSDERVAAAVEALGGDEPTARAAAETLWTDPRIAARVLATRLIAEPDGPRAARGLDLLRRLHSPDVTREVVLARLAAPGEKDARRALEALAAAEPAVGLGPALLKIAVEEAESPKAATAWALLGVVADPPSETLVAVATRVRDDSPDLAARLRAAANAARINAQVDLVGFRNFPSLSEEQTAALSALPERLADLRAKKADAPADRALVAAANGLSAVLGLTTLEPLTNVKLVAAARGGEGAPTVLLDGDWASAEASKSWRPRGEDGNWVVLDLGAERIVEGVRLWGHNVRGQGYEGWKTAEIYVGDDPSTLTLAGAGFVPRGPTSEKAADYGATIAIAPTRGRFVRLFCRGAWSGTKSAGLTEVQVLGRDP